MTWVSIRRQNPFRNGAKDAGSSTAHVTQAVTQAHRHGLPSGWSWSLRWESGGAAYARNQRAVARLVTLRLSPEAPGSAESGSRANPVLLNRLLVDIKS